MFYIYRYTNPSNNQPFYIGKGKGTRATDHMMNAVKSPKNKTRFKNKIEALKQAGTPPIIHYIIENIIDEDQAYELEKKYIKLYGRKGYDDGGVLLNVCEDSRPPNHKGKTYKEIYGDGWEEQIEKRRKIQLERGGFGPKKHSEETKNKISESNVGKKANENQIENSKRMGLMNKGKKHYSRATLLYIEGINQFVYSNDLRVFCRINEYSLGTFQSQLSKNWPMSRKGKNKGLLIRIATETEITAYIVGGVKKDVDGDTFKGFSL